jgi:ribonuclease HI
MSIGVFWGTDYDRNFHVRITDEDLPMTEGVAALIAAKYALQELKERYAKPWKPNGQRFCKVLILTDSEYLVRGMSQCPWGELTGADQHYLSRRQEFGNEQLFQELDAVIANFEDNDLPVWFLEDSSGG